MFNYIHGDRLDINVFLYNVIMCVLSIGRSRITDNVESSMWKTK